MECSVPVGCVGLEEREVCSALDFDAKQLTELQISYPSTLDGRCLNHAARLITVDLVKVSGRDERG